jgi:hypothetical protein
MTIDLLKLAKQVEETYIDVVCSFGTIRVHHVPDAMLISCTLDRPEPEQPTVRMKTVTGFQDRPSKQGDKVYDEWLKDKADYDNELFRLRSATRVVAALPSIDYPEVDKPPTSMAASVYNGHWPDDEVLRKKIWLDFTILARRDDSDAIFKALNSMTEQEEPTDSMVNEAKKNSE